MRRISFSILLLLSFCFLTSSAAAVQTINQDHVQNISYNAPEGLSFSSIELNDLESNSNTTVYLNQYGETYSLNVNAQKYYFSQWVFDITLINPNGSIETRHLTNIAPLASTYDLAVDSFWSQLNSSMASTLDLRLYTSFRPLTTNIVYWGNILDAGVMTETNLNRTVLPFSSVSIDSSSYFDLTLYAVDEEELAAQQNKSILAALSFSAGGLFSWAWDNIVSLVERIPYVGTYLSAVLVLAGMSLDSIVFYTNLLFVEYSETTFLTLEFFILSYSFCKRGTFWVKMERVVSCHVKLIELFILIAQAAVRLFTNILQAIAQAINALKPI